MIVQNKKMVTLMDWIAAEGRLRKVYKPEDATDWSGIFWHGNTTEVPRDSPTCGWKGELCEKRDESNNTRIIIVLSVLCILLLICILVAIYVVKNYKYENSLKEFGSVIVDWSNVCIESIPLAQHDGGEDCHIVGVVTYKGQQVVMEPLGMGGSINLQDRSVLVDLKQMRGLTYENINTFVGICTEVPNVCILMAHESRGSLQDIINSVDVTLDWDFKVSLVRDLVHGIWYLHRSAVGFHGHLTSAMCVVDSRWTCKITGHGLRYIRKHAGTRYSDKDDDKSKLLWTAPELLRKGCLSEHGTTMVDIYSVGIIMYEIVLETSPYWFHSGTGMMHPSEIIVKVTEGLEPPVRPHLPDKLPLGWAKLVAQCWEENPQTRPTITQVIYSLRDLTKGMSLYLVDNMIRRLEIHTQNLEDNVADRTKDLLIEKAKVEVLLSALLPISVADKLKVGRRVDPEHFENVTIFFSDIVGFTHISSNSSPTETVIFLNNMYTLFDELAQQFDVYKVATIGDAYMVASGVPIRNNNQHAIEICNFAVVLLDSIKEFPIPHMPGEFLHMRIGVHSGPCVAGVAGIKMPRYLLFGDTVGIAAKMESAGESMKIHVSGATYTLLEDSGHFVFRRRDQIYMEGIQTITTYWLELATE